MVNCYCGGRLKVKGLVSQCGTCKRLFVIRDNTPVILVPHNGWVKDLKHKEIINDQLAVKGEQVRVEWNCMRCGGRADFDGQSHRVTCSDELCGYSTSEVRSEGRPKLDVALTQRRKVLLARMVETDNKEEMAELVVEFQQVKVQQDAISEERL